MGIGAKITAAVAAGYLLGRWHKLRLAMLVGGMLAGKKISTDPQHLLRHALAFVESNEELAQVSSQVKGQLAVAARDAALKVAADQVGSLTQNLRTRSPDERPDDGEAEDADIQDEDSREDEPESDSREDEPEADVQESDDEQGSKPRARKSSSGSKSSGRSRARSSSSRAGSGSHRSSRRTSGKA